MEKNDCETGNLPEIVNEDNDNAIDMHLLHTHGLGVTYMESNELLQSGSSLYTMYKLVGDYVIGNILGNGTYAEVREALNLSTLQRLAVKVITKNTVLNKAFGKVNIINEVKVLSKHRHKNIIKMHALLLCKSTETVYFVLDYCVCSLEDLIQLSSTGKISHSQAHLLVLTK